MVVCLLESLEGRRDDERSEAWSRTLRLLRAHLGLFGGHTGIRAVIPNVLIGPVHPLAQYLLVRGAMNAGKERQKGSCAAA